MTEFEEGIEAARAIADSCEDGIVRTAFLLTIEQLENVVKQEGRSDADLYKDVIAKVFERESSAGPLLAKNVAAVVGDFGKRSGA